MTSQAGTATVPPSDYRLLLPEGWFRVHIEPQQRVRSVEALVNRQFEGTDSAPHIKQRLRQELLTQAEAAYEEGGIELYISLQRAGALTVPASLLVSLVPPLPGGSVPTVSNLASRYSENVDADVSEVELPAGTALRVRRSTGEPGHPAPMGAAGSSAEALPSVTVSYQMPVPGTGGHLLLTFSSPLVRIADAMTELFDAVAGSLTWVGGDGSHE
ncbi:hypothetical protein [Streptomyces sp. NPDC000134]|uniref:hypothetical protein n=1 Tax=Streptomyces sp. NPDC000134 TaxID=3364536 RepID=UPI00369F0286